MNATIKTVIGNITINHRLFRYHTAIVVKQNEETIVHINNLAPFERFFNG